MKVVLFTSGDLRHKFIAHQLAQHLELKLIVTETKSPKIEDTAPLNPEDMRFVQNHFKARKASENYFFGKFQDFPSGISLIQVPHSKINSENVWAEVQRVQPELIVLFGTSIIERGFLEQFPGKIINLHLGLSPYYRGSATNLFPYLFEEPECVGYTVHLATVKVDKGAILQQSRPQIKLGDSLHDIGNKSISQAGSHLPRILNEYLSGKIKPVEQVGTGRICEISHLTPEKLRTIYSKFETGMLEDYLKNKTKRDEGKPIVEQIFENN